MVIVDTTVWIDYLGGLATPHTAWLDRELDRQRLGLTDVILCEVLQGVRDDRRFGEALNALLSFEIFTPGTVELAIAAARNYRALRARGRTVRTTVDSLIATFCLRDGHVLLHNDRDFDAFEEVLDLRVVHP